MSNHHHLVVADSLGELPNFLRELHRLTAKAMNASQGQWENLWSAEPCNAVRLADDEDVVDKIAYVAVNPVAAGLVAKPEEWPELSLSSEGAVTLARPEAYFRNGGECPERVSLCVASPCVQQPGRVQLAIVNKSRKRITRCAPTHRPSKARRIDRTDSGCRLDLFDGDGHLLVEEVRGCGPVLLPPRLQALCLRECPRGKADIHR